MVSMLINANEIILGFSHLHCYLTSNKHAHFSNQDLILSVDALSQIDINPPFEESNSKFEVHICF